MGVGHSTRQQAGHPPVVLDQLHGEPRRVGCAGFLRADALGTRHANDDLWTSQDFYRLPGQAMNSTKTNDEEGKRSRKATKSNLVKVTAGLKTVLAQRKKVCAPEESQGEENLSTVQETTGSNAREASDRPAMVRPHSVASERSSAERRPERCPTDG